MSHHSKRGRGEEVVEEENVHAPAPKRARTMVVLEASVKVASDASDVSDASSDEEEEEGDIATMSHEAAAALAQGHSRELTLKKLSPVEAKPFSSFIAAALREEQVMNHERGTSSALSTAGTQARMVVRDLLLEHATAALTGGGPRRPFVSRGAGSYFALDASLGTKLSGGAAGMTVAPYVVLFETTKRIAQLTPETLKAALEAVERKAVMEQREVLEARYAKARGKAKAAVEAMTEADKLGQAFVAELLEQLRALLYERVADVQFVEAVGRKAKGAAPTPTTGAMMDAIRTWAAAKAAVAMRREKKAKALSVIRTARDNATAHVLEFMEKEKSDSRFFELKFNNKLMRLRVKQKHRPAKFGKNPTMPWVKKLGSAFLSNSSAIGNVTAFMNGTEASRKAFIQQFVSFANSGFESLSKVLVKPAETELVIEHARKRGSDSSPSAAAAGQVAL